MKTASRGVGIGWLLTRTNGLILASVALSSVVTGSAGFPVEVRYGDSGVLMVDLSNPIWFNSNSVFPLLLTLPFPAPSVRKPALDTLRSKVLTRPEVLLPSFRKDLREIIEIAKGRSVVSVMTTIKIKVILPNQSDLNLSLMNMPYKWVGTHIPSDEMISWIQTILPVTPCAMSNPFIAAT